MDNCQAIPVFYVGRWGGEEPRTKDCGVERKCLKYTLVQSRLGRYTVPAYAPQSVRLNHRDTSPKCSAGMPSTHSQRMLVSDEQHEAILYDNLCEDG